MSSSDKKSLNQECYLRGFPIGQVFLLIHRSSKAKQDFPGGSGVKKKICLPMQETHIWSLGQEDPLEGEMATHSSIHAWEIPRTEEPGGLQFMGLQRAGHDWVTKHSTALGIPPGHWGHRMWWTCRGQGSMMPGLRPVRKNWQLRPDCLSLRGQVDTWGFFWG